MTTTAQQLQQEIDQGALIVANHSGGKDSQAMLIELAALVPTEQLLVVHASLGELEWPGALELAQQQATDLGCTFKIAQAAKTLFDMVERRYEKRPEVPSWPSASHRQCTSDLKRDPIQKVIRHYADAQGFTRVVNCLGIRAEESNARAKRVTWAANKKQTNSKRTWFECAPIHAWSVEQVFGTIAQAGQEPHQAYALGNDRLSCVFCIMASDNDLKRGAQQRPELFQKYIALEQKTGYTMHQSQRALIEIVAVD